jgi:ketosteroid isomerase-like protein
MIMRAPLLIPLLCLVVSAQASTRTEIAARYRSWDAAYRAHDVAALGRLLAPGFRLVTGSGKVLDRAAYVKILRAGKAPAKYQTTLLTVSRNGARAKARTKELSQMPGEKAHTHRYVDTWALRAGRWQLTESRTLGED